jgi:NAD-dependent dihydropyrimidine dehydrogenase PreA subunit
MTREEIPWFPTVDAALCVGCRVCYDFCSHHVYAWDDAKDRAVVVRPYECVVGCSNCSRKCEAAAISFPPLSILKDVPPEW